MISFSCVICGKQFSVPDAYGGRAARCKGCGNEVQIPQRPANAVDDKSVPDSKLSSRARRLLAEAAAME